MNFKGVSIKWKAAAPIIAAVSIGIFITIIVTGKKTESIVVDEAKNSTLAGYRDTVLNSLTTMMMTENYGDAKNLFLGQMRNIVELRVIKTEAVDRDYGRGDAQDYVADAVEKEVIEKGTEKFVLQDSYIRGVFPYTAKTDFMGKNCLSCHKVSEGTVLGAISIKVPLIESFHRIRSLQYLYVALGLAGILGVTGLVIVIVGIIYRPLSVLAEKMKGLSGENLDTAVDVKDRDEIDMLNERFDNMMSAIRARDYKIKEQIEEHSALFNVGEILNRSDSIDEASNLVLNAISIGFGAEECAIMVMDEVGRIHLKSFIGISKDKAELVKDYMEVMSSAKATYSLDSEKYRNNYSEVSSIAGMIADGDIFVAPGSKDTIGDFLIVPLKSAKRLLGVITLHRIKGRYIKDIDNIEDIKQLFKIVSMQVSPYFLIGMSLDEKRTMKISPFGCFLDLIKGHFDAVREYYGVVSLAVIKVENYNDLCRSMGVDNASERVQEVGSAISAAIDKVHDATRITEIKIVVILPMVDRMEAAEIIDRAVMGAGSDVVLKSKIVSYPEDGDSPAQLMFLAYV